MSMTDTRELFRRLYMLTIEDLIAEGDTIVARWRSVCTDTATGTRITNEGITIVRIADGRIAEFWKHDDALGVLPQLGKTPQS